jgi:hypothetical protein
MLHDKYKAWIRASKEYDTDDDLRFPLIVRFRLVSRYVMFKPQYVECILGNAVLDFPSTAMTRIGSEAYNKLRSDYDGSSMHYRLSMQVPTHV